jgi:hypothetical protein
MNDDGPYASLLYKRRILVSQSAPDAHAQRRQIPGSRGTRPPLTANGNGECISLPHSPIRRSLHATLSERRFNGKSLASGGNIIRHTTLPLHNNLHIAPMSQEVVAEVEIDVERYDSASPEVDPVTPSMPVVSPGTSNVSSHALTSKVPFDVIQCEDVGVLKSKLMEASNRIGKLQQANASLAQTNEENKRLKMQLDKANSRAVQLESFLLERNLRLKQLLSENIQMSAKLKRLQSEFGVDAVSEVLNKGVKKKRPLL